MKYAVENQDIVRLRSELVTRLVSEHLVVQDLYCLLFQSGDSDLQQRVIQHLNRNAQDAASIITIALNREGGWEEFNYIELANCMPYTIWLEVSFSPGSPHISHNISLVFHSSLAVFHKSKRQNRDFSYFWGIFQRWNSALSYDGSRFQFA